MDPKQILTRAREILTPPKAWTRGTLARDKNHNSTNLYGEDAICFCSIGAIVRAAHQLNAHEAEAEALLQLSNVIVAGKKQKVFISDFNDDPDTTHTDVLNLFDRAIASCP